MNNSPFLEKKEYLIEGLDGEKKTFCQTALSISDSISVLVKIFAETPIDKIKNAQKNNDIESAIDAISTEYSSNIARILNVQPSELDNIPGKYIFRIVADFFELNLDENFTKDLERIKKMGAAIFSTSSKS